MNRLKNLFKTTNTKRGSYSVGLTGIVIAIIVVINLVVAQLPTKFTQIDVSDNNLYEISDTSKELLSGLKNDIDIVVLETKDNTDSRISTFLEKYVGQSDKLNLEWIDPVLHPSALTDYNASQDSIIVSCDDTGKSKTISFSDIIEYDTSSYYYTGSATESAFDGDGELTSAINYVTNDVGKTIYLTEGHGEITFSDTMSSLMDKNSYTVSSVNLLMTNEIPDDCDLLMIYAPANDISEDEATLLDNYLAAGGKVFFIEGDTNVSGMPNLAGILEEYGLEPVEGYIADTERCYQGYPYYIFPELNLTGDLANEITSEMVLVINSRGFVTTDPARDTITTTTILSTGENGYAVTDDEENQGTYVLGAVATETVATDSSDSEDTDADSDTEDSSETTEGRLTMIASDTMIDSQVTDTLTTLDNTTLFMNLVSANFEGTQNLSIPSKSLEVTYNTVQYGGYLSLLVVFGLPIVILIAGFMVWMRRRKA